MRKKFWIADLSESSTYFDVWIDFYALFQKENLTFKIYIHFLKLKQRNKHMAE